MPDKTEIEWTDATWNPTRGCSRVSPGCGGANHQGGCYAEKIAARFSGPGQAFEGYAERGAHRGRWTGKVGIADDMLNLPLRWRKPRRIFVNSMSDLFHEALPDEAIDKVFAVMALAPQHTYQVLTKRAVRMRAYFTAANRENNINGAIWSMLGTPRGRKIEHGGEWRAKLPLPGVWLGTSVEDQERADERIPDLLATPAARRFLSCEPLLGPVDFRHVADDGDGYYNALSSSTGPNVDWVIAGGESGPGARPMHPDWARALRDQCQAAGVPYFFKQWGEWLPWSQFTSVDDDAEQTRFATREWDGAKWTDVGHPMWCDTTDGNINDEQCVGRVGKKASGAKLDGREWREFPGEPT